MTVRLRRMKVDRTTLLGTLFEEVIVTGVVEGNNNALNGEFEAERLARLGNAER